MFDENFINKMATAKFDDTILSSLKANKFILKDESVLYTNKYLAYKTPKSLKLLKDDWTLIDVVIKVFYSYIETNLKTGKPTIKEDNTYALKYIENGIENENETEENVISKILYELALKEFKWKWKIKIQLEPSKLLHIQYIKRWFSTYEIYFQKKTWWVENKVLKASNDHQVNFLANYYMKKNSEKYLKVDYIYKIDFWKSFWEQMFINTQKRKKMKTKELLDFTRKLYKYHKAYTAATPRKAIETLVWSTEWNIRSTSIAMANIMKENGIENAYETFSKLNEEDLKLWKEPNFDNVYLSILKLSWWASFSFSEAYNSLSELIERKVFLWSALKSAIKWPSFVLIFLLIVWTFTVNMFAPILFEIYTWVWEPIPKLTKALKDGIDFIFTTNYPPNLMALIPDTLFLRQIVSFLTSNTIFIILIIYMIFASLSYFTKNSFYWRKSMHNIMFSLPIFWWFFKKSEYEIFLTVASQLYWKWASNHWKALPILKTTVKNYHLQWVINTAANKFNIYNIVPWEMFVKYPDYVDEKVANLFKTPDPDESEMITLKEAYKIDNDEFIWNLKWIIQNIMLMISGAILLIVILATIIPMLELATKI